MEETKAQSPKKNKKILLWVLGIILLWVCLTFIIILLINPSSSEKLRSQLQELDSSFMLYYPEKLPTGVKPTPNSLGQQNELVSYSFTKDKDDTIIFVTQQPRQQQMEEVNKVKDIPTPYGKAYIANLEKRTVGFLLTDTTLVIISSSGNLENSVLEALLQNTKPL